MTSYTKLKDGTWGIRGAGLVEGTTVQVTKKSGETKSATVGQIIWTGADKKTGAVISLARIAQSGSGRSSRTSSYGDYCGYQCPVSRKTCNAANGPCHDCQ